jgi:hypothetical protein
VECINMGMVEDRRVMGRGENRGKPATSPVSTRITRPICSICSLVSESEGKMAGGSSVCSMGKKACSKDGPV